MGTTQRLPVPIDLASGRLAEDHLIPQLEASSDSGFICIKTGKPSLYGQLAYLGVEVTSQEILDRFREEHGLPLPEPVCLERVDRYLTELQKFRLGDILKISYTSSGDFELRKHTEHPPREPRKLPG